MCSPGLARLCLSPVTSSIVLQVMMMMMMMMMIMMMMQCGGLDALTRVTSEEMFREDETVKLAVVAAVRSVCAEYTESFV